jgi:feruloyl esterase
MRLIGSTIVTASAFAIAALLSATSGHAQSAARCADLAKLTIPPSEIGLPSGGASISSAQMQTVPADPKTPGTTRDYCKVLGAIAPVDPKAPPINFQVNLPLQWNGKAVQYGGGGYNGTLITGLTAQNAAKPDTPVPVARGFATWGTDSGHDAAKLPEIFAFALNDEALVNFAYASYKKTRDVGHRIAAAFYDRPPSRIYYFGISEGGREGLTMAQRFPADFDGIYSGVPVINWTGLQSAGNRSGMLQQNGGWLKPAKVELLRKAVNAACDATDGLADGVIGAYEKCLGVFNPKMLRCPTGIDAGDDCLSDAQVAAVETLHRPFEFPFPLANGVTFYPGWNYGGEHQSPGFVSWLTGPQPAKFPLPSEDIQGRAWYYGNGAVRYFIARDPNFNSFRYSPSDFADRIRYVSSLMDSTDPDLSAFLARGGKLILKEHGADFAQSPFAGIEYYKSVVAKLGQARVNSFVRFYVAPGATHGGVVTSGTTGEAIPSAVDLLGVLDQWVESGIAPETLTLVEQQRSVPFNILSSRPMCRYPLYPRYNGRGDPKQASSFTCTPQ